MQVFLLFFSFLLQDSIIVFHGNLLYRRNQFEKELAKMILIEYDSIYHTQSKIRYQQILAYETLFSQTDKHRNSSNHFFAIMGITINNERKTKYVFSDPYFVTKQVIIGLKTLDITKNSTLRVGYQKATTHEKTAQGLKNNSRYQFNILDAFNYFDYLYRGSVDALIADNSDLYFVDNLKIIDELPSADIEYSGILFNQNNDFYKRINLILKQLINRPEFYSLLRKYSNPEAVNYDKQLRRLKQQN